MLFSESSSEVDEPLLLGQHAPESLTDVRAKSKVLGDLCRRFWTHNVQSQEQVRGPQEASSVGCNDHF